MECMGVYLVCTYSISTPPEPTTKYHRYRLRDILLCCTESMWSTTNWTPKRFKGLNRTGKFKDRRQTSVRAYRAPIDQCITRHGGEQHCTGVWPSEVISFIRVASGKSLGPALTSEITPHFCRCCRRLNISRSAPGLPIRLIETGRNSFVRVTSEK